jgi:hypothetical protein
VLDLSRKDQVHWCIERPLDSLLGIINDSDPLDPDIPK